MDTGSTRCSGDDDAASSVETGSKVPSFCGSDASGAPGDVAYTKDLREQKDMLMLPDGEDSQRYGEIVVLLGRFEKVTDPLLGDGHETAVAGDGDGLGSQSNAQQKGPRGTFGVVQGNWGQPGTVVNAKGEGHMFHDLKSGPGTFICLQEGTQKIYDVLTSEGTPGIRGDGSEGYAEERDGKLKVRPTAQFMGLRGPEPPNERALIICARQSHVINCRMRLY